ncbi:hypothetical protein [Microbulbifer sp. S227A]|uniref:hypothetical protein n=1 Tax=Microbulbifer sp. S227A TaxID=3415131 RepID=UPI003C7E638D
MLAPTAKETGPGGDGQLAGLPGSASIRMGDVAVWSPIFATKPVKSYFSLNIAVISLGNCQ